MRTLVILVLLLGGCVSTPAPCPKGQIYHSNHCVLYFQTAREVL